MNETAKTNLLEPLRNAGFSTIWLANTLSLTAFWMTEVACAWQMRLMTDADPLLVAATYTALQLPIVILVIPAGVLTDLSDRRHMMIWTHIWLGASLGLLLALVLTGLITPLLMLTFLPLVAIGQAMRMPGIATIIPDLVRAAQIPAAVSLNAIGQTSSRLLGPALAGIMVAAFGVDAVLAINTAIMVAIVILFLRLDYARRAPKPASMRREFMGAVREGMAFALVTRWKRNVLIRLGSFFACSAAVPALMAVRFDDSEVYGFMYACFGAGSLAGLLAVGKLGHQRLDQRLSTSLLCLAVLMTLLGTVDGPPLVALLLAGIGACWTLCSNSIMVAAQMQLDSSIRGRGLSFIFAVGTACLAGGGILWGSVARATTASTAVTISGFCLLLALLVTYRLSISAPQAALAPSTADS